MLKSLRNSIVFLTWMILLTGVVYPAGVTVVGNILFSKHANGSLVIRDNKIIGSELIGQNFPSVRFFRSRPSSTYDHEYNSAFSGGSNLAVTGDVWKDKTLALAKQISVQNASPNQPVPIDLVTASASGLDPHISVASARYQAQRVADTRNLPRELVDQLIDRFTSQPDLGFLGEPRVNVLLLNLALDELQ